MTTLAQMARVVLDTVKFLDRGEADYEFPGYTDEELEELLGKSPLRKTPESAAVKLLALAAASTAKHSGEQESHTLGEQGTLPVLGRRTKEGAGDNG